MFKFHAIYHMQNSPAISHNFCSKSSPSPTQQNYTEQQTTFLLLQSTEMITVSDKQLTACCNNHFL